jgi:hypothetical protein
VRHRIGLIWPVLIGLVLGMLAPLMHASRGLKRPKSAPPSGMRDPPDEVFLGVATPTTVRRGEAFVARFAAYTLGNRDTVIQVLREEAPTAVPRLGLHSCLWHRGARVTVRLTAESAAIDNPVQSFVWDGRSQFLRFDVRVPPDAVVATLILRFDVAVEGLSLVFLRPEIALSGDAVGVSPSTSDVVLVERKSPTTAFASYTVSDRRDVLSRVRSLEIFTDVDVFVDCLSMRPGVQWQSTLEREIRERDVFWLFWSRQASKSRWVDWEWRRALASKSLTGIQPHPLEPAELAPPPPELAALQFGAQYESYLAALKESKVGARVRRIRYRPRKRRGT